MRKKNQIIGSVLCAAVGLSGLTMNSFAADDVIYGTMNIPYNEFYAAEDVCSEVDAVASATTSKWNNENLTAGTYNSANADGTGTILGVTYPVAIARNDLDALGENNYGFTELNAVPAAYKTVTISGGKAEFSKVSGDSSAVSGVETSISSDTPWGDYVIDVTSINNAEGTSDIGTIYGVVLLTEDGEGYGMRHLQNIWRDEIAWSSGFMTSEPHGSTLDYEDYESLMGKTITEIRYITDSGYHNLSTSLYVPVKFDGTVSVSDSTFGDGSANISTDGFPEDYDKSYSVEGLEANISDSAVDYKNAFPGTYTLNISDSKGVYANMSAEFTLSTDEMPAAFDGEKLVKADGSSDEDFRNFLKNISVVNVNGSDYSASGRHSIAIIGEDGTIDYKAKTGRGENQTAVFGGGEYSFTVTAAGYNKTLSFSTNGSSSAGESGAASSGSLTRGKSADKGNPGTGNAGAMAALSAAVISALAVLAFKKRK